MDVKKILGFGLVIWVALVAVSLVLFSLEKPDPAFFESLKFLALGTTAVAASALYVRSLNRALTANIGFVVGGMWALIAFGLDSLLYAFGLFNLSFYDYVKDVASSYLILPIAAALIFGLLKNK